MRRNHRALHRIRFTHSNKFLYNIDNDEDKRKLQYDIKYLTSKVLKLNIQNLLEIGTLPTGNFDIEETFRENEVLIFTLSPYLFEISMQKIEY